MRSSKSRSRSKQNNRPRTLGNIVNRVFDSSGPEGKVRGTPQQIIEKYQLLARDAQLSNDRVAAEAFLQHAEHYTRMLAEAQRELAAEQEARQQHYQQNGGHNGQGNGNQNGNQNGGGYQNNRDRDRDGNRDGNRNWRDDRPADFGSSDQPDLAAPAPQELGTNNRTDDQDRSRSYDIRDQGRDQGRDQPDAMPDTMPDTMLVETPETRAPRAEFAPKPKSPPREGSTRSGNSSGNDKPQKPRAPKKPKDDAPTLAFDQPAAQDGGAE